MLKFFLTVLLVIAPLSPEAAVSLAPGMPATSITSTNSPAATPPTSIAIGDIVTQAQTLTAQLETKRGALSPDDALQSVNDKLPPITQAIEDRITADAPLLDNNGPLASLQKSQLTWQGILSDLADAQNTLSKRVKDLDNDLADLTTQAQNWKATQAAAPKANAPPETVQRIAQVISLIADTTKMVRGDQNDLYLMQNRVAQQDAWARRSADKVAKAAESARKRVFEQNRPALWKGEALERPNGGIVAQERISIGAQFVTVQDYLTQKIGAVLVHLFLFGILAGIFYWLRNSVRTRAEKEESLRGAANVFGVPMANALLLGLIAGWWLYPEIPNLLLAALGAIALVPAVIILRRLIEPALFPVLYAIVFFFALDQVRLVVRPGGVLSRFLLLAELIAVCLFLIATLRSRQVAVHRPDATRFEKMARTYFHAAFFVFAAAGFANVFGYIQLSVLLSGGMLQSSYFALVFYAGVRVLDALALSALCVQPLNRLRMVRRNHDLIYRNTSTAMRWAVLALWLLLALYAFQLFDPVYNGLSRLLAREHTWGSMHFHLGSIVAFPITVWATFIFSRFVRFCLEEEIYPHFQLARGVPYAVSTVVHYAILVIGLFVALNALGVDLSQYTVLTAAFGVGLGFGLQNILNNFMSGLILLFERPIKVGDTVQFDANTMGKVERIGIRASVILLTNGSELIVPNGNLISNPVTNWTLSNSERLIEIPVSVTSKVNPQHVLDLLTKTATAHPHVLRNPSPQAVLVTIGASLVFRLRAWIDSEEEWMKITSEISLAINEALAQENIALG